MRCKNTGCTREATCIPRICVPATGWAIDSHKPLELVLAVEMCDECFESLTTEQLAPKGMERGIRDIVVFCVHATIATRCT